MKIKISLAITLVVLLVMMSFPIQVVSAQPAESRYPSGGQLANWAIKYAERLIDRAEQILDQRDAIGRDTSENREYLQQARDNLDSAKVAYNIGRYVEARRYAQLAARLATTAIITPSLPLITPPPQPNLIIDVPSVDIEGDFLLNGSPFPASQYQDGNICMRDSEGIDRVELGNTHDLSYSISIVPGSYDINYAHENGSDVPQNIDNTVNYNVVINTNQTVDVAVSSASVRAYYTLNGEAFPATVYHHAAFYLQEVSGGEPILLGLSHQSNDPVEVMHGTYDVVYRHQQGNLVPLNKNAIIMSDIVISGDVLLEINVPCIDLTSSYELNGSPFPVSIYNSAEFYLRNPEGGDEVFLGSSFNGVNDNKIIPGDYDVVYKSLFGQGQSVPLNKDKVVDSVALDHSQAITIDVPAGYVTGQYTHNGANFPNTIYQSAQVFLRESGTDGDLIRLGRTNTPPSAVMVIVGSYDVIYSHFSGTNIPQNKEAVILHDQVISLGSQVLNVDIPSVKITGAFKLNGGSFPGIVYQSAEISLRPVGGTELILLGRTHQTPQPVTIVAGSYDIVYSHSYGTTGVPRNEEKIILTGVLLNVSQTLEVDVNSNVVRPLFKLNGGSFPASIYQSAILYLRDPDTNDLIMLGRTFEEADELLIVDGTYEVVYSIAYGGLVPQNTLTNLFSVLLN